MPSAYNSPKSELSNILGSAALHPRCIGQVCMSDQVTMVWAKFWFFGCPNRNVLLENISKILDFAAWGPRCIGKLSILASLIYLVVWSMGLPKV